MSTKLRALLLGAGLVAAVASATEGPPPGIPGLVPEAHTPADQVDALAHQLGQGLRCPVCQGLSVADSTSSAAVMMQQRIRELVAEGYSEAQIEAYFVSKYGEWVLLAPPATGMNQIVWLGPLAAALGGLFLAGRFVRRTVASDDGPDTVVDEAHGLAPGSDPHLDRLLQDVDDA